MFSKDSTFQTIRVILVVLSWGDHVIRPLTDLSDQHLLCVLGLPNLQIKRWMYVLWNWWIWFLYLLVFCSFTCVLLSCSAHTFNTMLSFTIHSTLFLTINVPLEEMRISQNVLNFNINTYRHSGINVHALTSVHTSHHYPQTGFCCSFPFCPFGNIRTSAGTVTADVLKKREWSRSKLQLQGTFILNIGEQGDQSVMWSCYAKHIQTLTENSINQKIDQREKNEKLFL